MAVAPPQKTVTRFRGWLIERLKESGWVAYRGEDLEALAARLGLRAELLREAQAALAEECRRVGQQPRELGSHERRLGPRRRFDIVLPKLVYEHWQAYCQGRQLTESVLLRSVIHHLLSRPEPPSWLGAKWRYRGELLRVCLERSGQPRRGRYLTAVATDITPGAYQALRRRARHAGVGASALVRGGIIDLLEGRTRKLRVVVSVREMWDDPQRYWTRSHETK